MKNAELIGFMLISFEMFWLKSAAGMKDRIIYQIKSGIQVQ